jgi:hypothetical protein
MIYADMDEVKAAVESNGGVLTIKMGDLRDAYGKGRLGVHVRSGIGKSLNGIGLGHYPDPLTDSQFDLVRLYKLGSPVADLVGAVLHPSPGGDQVLREATGGEATGILAQVRELVCP